MALPCRHVEFFSTGKKPVETEAVCSTNCEPLKERFLCLSGVGCQRPLPRGGEAERLGSRCLNRDFHKLSTHRAQSAASTMIIQLGTTVSHSFMKCKCTIKPLKEFHWKLVCCKEFGFLLQWSTFVWNIYWDPLLIWKPLITRLYFISLPLSA